MISKHPFKLFVSEKQSLWKQKTAAKFNLKVELLGETRALGFPDFPDFLHFKSPKYSAGPTFLSVGGRSGASVDRRNQRMRPSARPPRAEASMAFCANVCFNDTRQRGKQHVLAGLAVNTNPHTSQAVFFLPTCDFVTKGINLQHLLTVRYCQH